MTPEEKRARKSAYNRQWQKENAEKHALSCKTWRDKNKDDQNRKRRERKLQDHFGITIAEYDRMLEDQNYKCKLCKADSCVTGRRFAVDHIHDMKWRDGELVDVNKGNRDAIRGLLCSACNTALGKFHDSPELLRAAAHYIEGNEQ